MALLFIVNGAALGSWLPRLPELRDRLGLGLAEVGLTLAAGGLGGLTGSAASGLLIGRFGPRRAAIGPALVLLLTLPLVSIAPTGLILAAVVMAAGLSDAIADVGMNALAVRVEQARKHSIMSRLHALWSLGSFGGSAISAGALAIGVDLRIQLVAIGLGGVGAVTVASRLVPDPEPRPRPRPRWASVVGLALAGLAVAIVEGAPVDWSAIYLTDVTEATATAGGAAFLVYMGGMLVGRAGGDTVVDRVGVRAAILLGLGMTTLGVVVVLAGDAAVPAFVGFALWGLGVSVMAPLFYRLAGAHRQFGEGGGLAALTVGNRLGFLTGPATIGALAAVASLPAALGAGVGIGLAGVLVAIGVSFRR